MNTIVKSSSGISLIPAESRLLADRKIFIKDEINSASAYEFITSLMLLVKEDPEKPIDIYVMDSPGGSVSAGLVIYDAIKGLKSEVNMHCVGTAASMAAIIVAGGQKGRRFILPRSKMMIHEPLLDGGLSGKATSIKRTADSIMETKRILVELLVNDTNKTKKEIEKAISYDNYMNAEEAIAFGLCDKIETTIV